ncbi:MAG: hypothetical protein ACYS8W_11190 [Planctomycetota bacterium]
MKVSGRSILLILPLAVLVFGSACAWDTVDMEIYFEEVAGRRGLTPAKQVRVVFADREEMRKLLQDELQYEFDNGSFELYKKTNELFGLISPGCPLKERLVELYLAVPGVYMPYQRLLVMQNGLDRNRRDSTLLHELAHALQDQHFALGEKLDKAKSNGDLAYAFRCLAEGDAVAVQMGGERFLKKDGDPVEYLRGIMSANRGWGGLGIPPAITAQVENCYVLGLTFIEAVHRAGGWPEVNSAYDKIASTEQIIHPAKYFSGREIDMPVSIDSALIGEDPFPGWDLISTNVHGEYMTGLILRQRVPDGAAERASSGWGGDRYWIFRESSGNGRLFYIWLTVWDGENDAVEFAEVIETYFSAKYPEAGIAHGIGEISETYFGHYREGKNVITFDYLPRETLRKVVAVRGRLLRKDAEGE